jgi:hypothetical protein
MVTGLQATCRDKPMHGQQRGLILMILLGTLVSQVGCVALNIPSHRFDDPTDCGGVLGPWRKGHCKPAHHHGDLGPHLTVGEFHDASGDCIDGGPLDSAPFDPSLDCQGNPKRPEVPWPRFHPVPTRPVFGSVIHCAAEQLVCRANSSCAQNVTSKVGRHC